MRQRNLKFFAYDIDLFDSQNEKIKNPTTQTEELELLKTLGFVVNSNYKECRNLKEVIDYYNYWHDKKSRLEYGKFSLRQIYIENYKKENISEEI